MEINDWLERDKTALASVLPRCSDIVALRGQGSWLYDVKWNRYLDFTSGIAANSTGHCHPKVVDAIKLQASTLIHTSVTTHHRMNIQLAERIQKLVPYMDEPQVFFCNSGAEAVDGAIKLARYITKKPGIIAFKGAFHGRTYGATSLTTAKEKYQDGYHPLMSNVYTLEYGDFSMTPVYPKWIGMMIVEPILGEGGYIVPPEGWLQRCREYCDKRKILLVFDEVQTGIGRTGHYFAAETFGVTPDVILFAKGIASGLPLGGIIASKNLLDQWPEGTHGSTFGGNPVACAAALATLGVVDDYCLFNVRKKGKEALERLKRWNARGVGYMIGIPTGTREQTAAIQQECLDHGLLVLNCGPNEDIIRLIPSLVASDDEWNMALGILENAMEKILKN
jgi:4-aminobutyrate aminotransferase